MIKYIDIVNNCTGEVIESHRPSSKFNFDFFLRRVKKAFAVNRIERTDDTLTVWVEA